MDPSHAAIVPDLLGDAGPAHYAAVAAGEAAWHKFLLFLALLFGIGGPHAVWSGWRVIKEARRLREQGVRVPGVVVRLTFSPSRGTDPGGTYSPVLRFRTAEGQDMETESDVGTSPAPAREGDQVTVIYDPQKPTLARIDSMSGRGTAIGGLLVAGGLLFTSIAATIIVNELL